MQTYKNIDEYIKKGSKGTSGNLEDDANTGAHVGSKRGGGDSRYGMPTIQIDGKNLLHYAVMKGHFGFYPAPTGVDALSQNYKKSGIEYSKGVFDFRTTNHSRSH